MSGSLINTHKPLNSKYVLYYDFSIWQNAVCFSYAKLYKSYKVVYTSIIYKAERVVHSSEFLLMTKHFTQCVFSKPHCLAGFLMTTLKKMFQRNLMKLDLHPIIVTILPFSFYTNI